MNSLMPTLASITHRRTTSVIVHDPLVIVQELKAHFWEP
jgi:hypothetical protein